MIPVDVRSERPILADIWSIVCPGWSCSKSIICSSRVDFGMDISLNGVASSQRPRGSGFSVSHR